MHQFKHDQIDTEASVSNELDVTSNLLHCMLIVSRKVARNTDQSRCQPIYLLRYLRPEFLHNKPLKLFAVIQEPIQIEQALIYYVLVDGSFVLNDHRTVVLIQTKRVNAPSMDGAGGVFACKEPDAE